MNNNYLYNMFKYDNAMNRRVFDLLRSLPSVDDRTMSIFAHMLTAKKVWLTRLLGKDSSGLSIWPALNFDECGSLIEENGAGFRDYLNGITDEQLSGLFRYKNSKGAEFENTIQDVLMHILIHGGYHRGQIAKAVRESGGEPVYTDYILYVRQPV